MNIVACVKRVPSMSELVDAIEINASKKDIKQDALTFKMNDWDVYAVEEAVRLKERLGGTVTLVTVGPREWDSILRTGLAMGADRAIRVDEDVAAADCHAVAGILTALIERLSCDLLMFGAQSEDFGSGQLGVMVAEMMDTPHAAVVTALEVKQGVVRVSRELEGGLLEVYVLRLPAVLTIQTGINKPRYISVARIRKAMERGIEVMQLDELGLSGSSLTPRVRSEKLQVPSFSKAIEIISASPAESAAKLAEIIRNLGLL